jgi:hypothetical protein
MTDDFSVSWQVLWEAENVSARARSVVQDSQRACDTARAVRVSAQAACLRSVALKQRIKRGRLAHPSNPASVRARRSLWPLAFAIAGVILAWNPISREVQISGRTFTVASHVSVIRMAFGAHILAAGHKEHTGAPQVISRLTIR